MLRAGTVTDVSPSDPEFETFESEAFKMLGLVCHVASCQAYTEKLV